MRLCVLSVCDSLNPSILGHRFKIFSTSLCRRFSNPHGGQRRRLFSFLHHFLPLRRLYFPNSYHGKKHGDTSMACIDEAPATVSPADMPNVEMVVKQDDTFNNGKESLTEGSQIDCFALEQESEKKKDKIVMEGSESSTSEDRSHPSDKNTELKMDVVNSITKLDAIKENSSKVRNEDSCHSHPRKKLLVLDVNGLIVDIVADPDEVYRADTVIGSKSVYKRPYCDEFLNFCFERFSVGVWTSRTRRNIERVLDFLIKDTQHQLLFCWDQSHCTETGFNTIENSDKPLVLKELKKLWEKQDPNLPWDKGVYDESNTFLLDDSPYKALRNPPNTAIFPYTYSYRNTQDNGLGPKGDLRNYLEKLAASDNVQKFIQQNPFGQQPISYNNESWKFYLKVIGDSATCPQQEADASKSCFRKKLLVIDVSGLLADVVLLPRERYKADSILQYKADTILPGSRAVFKRPYCDEFLQFCFDRFKVGMWASTSRFHTERVLDFLMRDTQHKLLFSWDLSDCTDTGFRTVENMNRPLVLKQLKKLWEKKDPNLPWDIGDYDESNTLLLDTYPSKALLNPPYTAIFPYTYCYWKTEDNSLGSDGDLRIYLEKLAASENVQKFVEQNPFGHRPITSKNLSWGFYQKVIRVFTSKSETDNITASALPTKSEQEADTAMVSALPIKLEPEADTMTDSILPIKLEQQTNTVTDSALPPQADTITDSVLPTKLEPETETITDSALPTKLEPKAGAITDSILPIKLEKEANTITDSALPNKLEPESGAITDSIRPIKLEHEANTVTDSALPTKLEPEAGGITDSALPTKSERESNTSPASLAETLKEPETETNPDSAAETLP
ncbi:unnamed protein product [Lactuca virosa]|uniref:FCP1 homology domain-containing protein n=1 Tax=Lactuca virosa TaxID=75947 RepID=A0AAU9NYY1_9ASTR|nr:unnamed protein product [Lactuca virosa]